MEKILPILMIAAIACTVIVLVIGLLSFAKNGPFYKRNANKIMRLRVLFQGIAILAFAIIAWFSMSGPKP